MSPVRPRPAVERDSAPWWAALARHELALARCDDCGAWRWPPRALCNRCGSLAWSWAPASGRGTIASWIVNRHGFGGAFPLPSTAVLVRLAEQDDLLLPGGWGGAADGADLAVGMEVEVGFEDVAAGPQRGAEDPTRGDADDEGPAFTVLRWTPAREAT